MGLYYELASAADRKFFVDAIARGTHDKAARESSNARPPIRFTNRAGYRSPAGELHVRRLLSHHSAVPSGNGNLFPSGNRTTVDKGKLELTNYSTPTITVFHELKHNDVDYERKKTALRPGIVIRTRSIARSCSSTRTEQRRSRRPTSRSPSTRSISTTRRSTRAIRSRMSISPTSRGPRVGRLRKFFDVLNGDVPNSVQKGLKKAFDRKLLPKGWLRGLGTWGSRALIPLAIASEVIFTDSLNADDDQGSINNFNGIAQAMFGKPAAALTQEQWRAVAEVNIGVKPMPARKKQKEDPCPKGKIPGTSGPCD